MRDVEIQELSATENILKLKTIEEDGSGVISSPYSKRTCNEVWRF